MSKTNYLVWLKPDDTLEVQEDEHDCQQVVHWKDEGWKLVGDGILAESADDAKRYVEQALL